MKQNDRISTTSEELMMDYYKRKAEEGGIFFGLDTGRYYTKLEDLRDDKFWKDNFDIDFRIAFGERSDSMNSYICHEPKETLI